MYVKKEIILLKKMQIILSGPELLRFLLKKSNSGGQTKKSVSSFLALKKPSSMSSELQRNKSNLQPGGGSCYITPFTLCPKLSLQQQEISNTSTTPPSSKSATSHQFTLIIIPVIHNTPVR